MKIVGKQFKNFRPSPGLMPLPSIQYFTRIYSSPRSLLVGFPASSILNTRPSKLRWRGIWNVAIFAKVWHFTSQWSLWMKAGCPSSCQRWSPSRCNGSQRVQILRKKPRSKTPPKNSCLLHSLIVTAWFTSIGSQKVKPSTRPTTVRLSRPFWAISAARGQKNLSKAGYSTKTMPGRTFPGRPWSSSPRRTSKPCPTHLTARILLHVTSGYFPSWKPD